MRSSCIDDTPRSNRMPSHLACPVTGFGQHALDPVVAGAHQHDPVAERCQPLAGDPQGVGVAVEADQPQAGQLGEEPLGVPAGAQGGVDEDGAGRRRRCCRVSAGVSSSTQRSSRTGTCPWSPGVAGCSAIASPPMKAPLHRGPCPRARTWRWGSTPGPVRAEATMHGRGRSAARSNDVAQSFIAGRGEVLFVGLLVVLPGLRRPRSPGSRPSRSPRSPWTGWRSGGGRPTT